MPGAGKLGLSAAGGAAFNSLFEMPCYVLDPYTYISILSILYLRCLKHRGVYNVDTLTAFNSLFEMRRFLPRVALRQYPRPFNSLFEMHRRGERRRRRVNSNSFNSLFEMP